MRYLLVQYVRRPNGQIDEQVLVSKRVKPADLQTMNVILDYGLRKVEKCVVEGQVGIKEWDTLNSYFKKIYPNLIEELEKSNPQVKLTE
jgi:hypothetical protein